VRPFACRLEAVTGPQSILSRQDLKRNDLKRNDLKRQTSIDIWGDRPPAATANIRSALSMEDYDGVVTIARRLYLHALNSLARSGGDMRPQGEGGCRFQHAANGGRALPSHSRRHHPE